MSKFNPDLICSKAIENWLNSLPGGIIQAKIQSLLVHHKGGDVNKVAVLFREECANILGENSGEQIVEGWFVQYSSNMNGSFIKICFGWGTEPKYYLTLEDVIQYVKNGGNFTAQYILF